MIPEFRIPGTLKKTSENCNTVVSAEYCKDCGKAEARFYHCNNWDCPDCYFWTASRAAHRLEERLLGVQRAYSVAGKHPGRIMHIVFSVPECEYDNFDEKTARGKCVEYAKTIGVLGGSLVFHAYRIKKEYHKPLYDALKVAGLPGGIWRATHDNLLGLDSWRSYVDFAPHYHILGFYPLIVMKSNIFHELTGWTYKALGVSQDRNVYRTARYMLTHLAVLPGQNIKYFGIASYSKTSVESLKIATFKTCPNCSSENYYLIECGAYRFSRFLEGLRPEGDEFFVHVRVVKTIRKFSVRMKQTEITDCGVIA